MDHIDKEIKEYNDKLDFLKIGYTKTIQDFSKELHLFSNSVRDAYKKMSFNCYRTISALQVTKQDTASNNKAIYTHISWAGEGTYTNQLAATTNKGIAYVYNIDNKGIVHEINFTNSELNTCSIEPSENNLLAAGGFDGGIYVTNINNLKNKDKKDETEEIKKFSGHQGVVSCCKFLNAFYLISSSYDSAILLWDINSQGKFINSYHDHTGEISGLDVNEQNGNIFATGSGDTTVKLWDIRDKKACVCTFKGSDSSVSCVKFLPGRVTTLAAGSEDSLIRLYDLRALKELALFKKQDEYNSINSLSFSKSGQLLFASSANSSKINCWDIFNEDEFPVYTYQHKESKKGIKQIALDSTGNNIGYILENQINILK